MKMATAILTSIIIVQFTMIDFSFGQQKKNMTKKSKAKKKPVTVTTAQIHDQLTKVLPTKLCDNDKKLMRCHKISHKVCLEQINKNLKKCINEEKVNRSLSAVETLRYSEKKGICVRKKMDYFLKRKKRKKCLDVKTK